MELIDKIKAEVEKKTHGEQGYSSGDAECGYRDCARDIPSFLDTLEAKEDLETFDKRVTEMWGRCAANPNDTIACLHIDSFIEIARYFYELGLKTKENKL